MAIRVIEFSSGGYKIRKKFGLRINILKENYWILRIGLVGRCQKLGIIFFCTMDGFFALFDTFPLHQFSNSIVFFEYLCWFLGKNLSNFVSSAWKLDNPYCHNDYYLQVCTANVTWKAEQTTQGKKYEWIISPLCYVIHIILFSSDLVEFWGQR